MYPEAQTLFHHVRTTRPDMYRAMEAMIRPHRIESFYRILQHHLRIVPDLDIFNKNCDKIPQFLFDFLKCARRNIPSPGDAFGIQMTCRITKTDTQETLDSRHLRDSTTATSPSDYNVQDVDLKYELKLFTAQNHVLEISNRRTYSSIHVDETVETLLNLLPHACHLWRGAPYNKGLDSRGCHVYLNTCRFLITDDHRIIYKSNSKDLAYLLRHLDGSRIRAYNDVKHVFKKCGIVAYYFNLIEIISSMGDDVMWVAKYQCRTGKPLPLNRDGLAAHPIRSPLEILSFEAPKKNFARFCTENKSVDVTCSTDKIFFGQQFNEGTGYSFSIMPAGHHENPPPPLQSET